ncbi:hypothetical protein HPP92_007077 [Vanilla planifolia]|uniref:Uncharacterized protein n=1 Tax=Vanilla planifolia TaxID=51239 RepID=A0A835RFN6_VANPL|nr:hypothetical protein HPP92_007077 [Vanilla planifolia]
MTLKRVTHTWPSVQCKAPTSRRCNGRCKTWGVSPRGASVGADLGGSSKYSNENFEGRRGERFHVNGTCTWESKRNSRAGWAAPWQCHGSETPWGLEELSFLLNSPSALETAQPRGRAADKEHRMLSGCPARSGTLENSMAERSTYRRTHNRIRSPR